jgi:DNA-binding transcriptional ArsR family regulator
VAPCLDRAGTLVTALLYFPGDQGPGDTNDRASVVWFVVSRRRTSGRVARPPPARGLHRWDRVLQSNCVDTQVDRDPIGFEFDEAVRVLKLLADPSRLKIVWALLHGEHSVNELAEHIEVPPAAVSQHLAKLRLARLVRTRREGTKVFYMAEDDHLERLVAEALMQADHLVGPDHRHGESSRAKRA